MTFDFRNWPLWGLAAHSLAFTMPRELRFVRPRRPELAARWRRGLDGQLECRWERAPGNATESQAPTLAGDVAPTSVGPSIS